MRSRVSILLLNLPLQSVTILVPSTHQTYHFIVEEAKKRTGLFGMLFEFRAVNDVFLYPLERTTVFVPWSHHALFMLHLGQTLNNRLDSIDFDLEQRVRLLDPRSVHDVPLSVTGSVMLGALIADGSSG